MGKALEGVRELGSGDLSRVLLYQQGNMNLQDFKWERLSLP